MKNVLSALLAPRQPTPTFKARPVVDAAAISACATASLLQELETWPKPGLVSHIDCGSHNDMNSETFRKSALAIEPYFRALAIAGAAGCRMGRLRVIGLDAERAMLKATSGINTHRGAIFGIGLLCAAAGARDNGRVAGNLSLGAIVSLLWGQDIIDGPLLLHSHGGGARLKFGAGGARMEAARGFPTVYEVGLPTLRDAWVDFRDDPEAVRVQTCFALISTLEDTNLLHRGGQRGLRYARHAADAWLREGGIANPRWRESAYSVHQGFVSRWLSPGGSADLLAMTLFVDAQERRSVYG
ncbi:triphosphoribosyl-dephospho-CoA synthase MdcB [Rhizobium laguerreae]|uniref:triphosphoribosyl-dephospho-CoA synthase MdcB n=1 Tax=Rhizobium laguerreae TaxID=1076926 RepID=UPI001C901063|nr:triphosphoribosyl-dephospho-CoA synthase MdcB [Rhizobium laguerreae]MBY3537544.1 triphosphoribosyl-dephospho-CoA synthase MdcB [Rhizobium laguerreae]